MKHQRARHPLIRSSRLLLAAAVLLLVALVAAPTPVAHAAVITVNDTSGGTGGPGCKLRDAIAAANANGTVGGCTGQSGADTIELPAGATITLTDQDNGNGAEINGLPAITSQITINGNNAIIERSSAGGTPNFRIFYVPGSGTLTLNNVTVRNGKTSVAPAGYSGYGGGFEVSNDGTLVVNNGTISGNSTGDATASSNSGWGGAIMAEASSTLTITNSTISGNWTGLSTGTRGQGGGIATNGVHLTVTNSTISGNTGGDYGGGIAINPGTDTVTSSTVTGNTAATGGGIAITGATVELTLRNTIVAMNTASVEGPNCSGPLVNGGNNIDDGTSCGWGSANGSMSGVDPRLGPLADNGGPTRTHRLLIGSPAVDGVTYNSPNSSPSTDQRGVARPQGGGYDIGAFENNLLESLFLPLIVKH